MTAAAPSEFAHVRREPIDEPVAVRRLDVRVVELEADERAVGADADEERATLAVQERGDGLDDRVLERGVATLFAHIPARSRLELDCVVLVIVEELVDRSCKGRCFAAQVLRNELGELSIRANPADDRIGYLVD